MLILADNINLQTKTRVYLIYKLYCPETVAPHNKKTSMKTSLSIILILSFLILSGCGTSKSPVLYPNHHLNLVGREVAQADIDDCMQQAYASGADEGKGREVAKETATAGVVGAATGSVIGAISSSSDVGRGAAIGGAGAVTAKLVRGAFKASDPSPIFMRFVDQCLREKGYQTLGWR